MLISEKFKHWAMLQQDLSVSSVELSRLFEKFQYDEELFLDWVDVNVFVPNYPVPVLVYQATFSEEGKPLVSFHIAAYHEYQDNSKEPGFYIYGKDADVPLKGIQYWMLLRHPD